MLYVSLLWFLHYLFVHGILFRLIFKYFLTYTAPQEVYLRAHTGYFLDVENDQVQARWEDMGTLGPPGRAAPNFAFGVSDFFGTCTARRYGNYIVQSFH